MIKEEGKRLFVKAKDILGNSIIYDPLISETWTVGSLITRDINGYQLEFKTEKDKTLFKLKYNL